MELYVTANLSCFVNSGASDAQTVEVALTGGGTMEMGGAANNNVFNPYDTTSLHIFIREAFPGATLMEEHQVPAVHVQTPNPPTAD